MHRYKRTIRLSETDVTGVIYFSELLKLGLETFEDFLAGRGFTLHQMMEQTDFLMPIVHAEADFCGPLRVGDLLEIQLQPPHLGNSSFTLSCSMLLNGKEMGKTKIVHVCTSKTTGASIPIPDQLKDLMKRLDSAALCP